MAPSVTCHQNGINDIYTPKMAPSEVCHQNGTISDIHQNGTISDCHQHGCKHTNINDCHQNCPSSVTAVLIMVYSSCNGSTMLKVAIESTFLIFLWKVICCREVLKQVDAIQFTQLNSAHFFFPNGLIQSTNATQSLRKQTHCCRQMSGNVTFSTISSHFCIDKSGCVF